MTEEQPKPKKPTEAELEALLADALRENDELRAEITELHMPPPTQQIPKSCINCGQSQAPLTHNIGEGTYTCPSCNYTWTDEEESAPFRQEG